MEWPAPPSGAVRSLVIQEEERVLDIAVLGVDLGKNVCSLVGLDGSGAVVMRRKVRRETLIALAEKLAPCVVGMEACCGAHHLGRVFVAHGHDVRLMSPEYVRPYVKAQKNDDRDAEMAAIEVAILEQIRSEPDLSRRFAILTTIAGVSAVTAFALLIEMPELGALEAGQAASLAGLAPLARQSGRSFIRGGRAEVRRAVYMPALVATQFNPDMKATYSTLTAAGKPAKVALTAVMRKIVVLANALLKANRTWTPKHA